MDDREKNKEHEEFSKFYHEQYYTGQKAEISTHAANRPQQAAQKEQQRQNAGCTIPPKRTTNGYGMTRQINRQGGTGNSIQQTNRTGPLQKQEMNYQKPPRKLALKKRRQRQIKILSCATLAVFILATAIVLIVHFCANATDVLKGTWDLDGVTMYQFDGKGSGSLNLPSNNYAFTYEINDGTLIIDFESEAARDKTYTFTADKNKLTLTDNEEKESKTFELTKQND